MERNNSLAGRMKTKAEKEIGLLSWLRERVERRKGRGTRDRNRHEERVIVERERERKSEIMSNLCSIPSI